MSMMTPHVMLSRAWGEYPFGFRYSVVTQVDELYFYDGSVAIRADDETWSAVSFTQVDKGSEADLFVASTRLETV